MRSFKEFAYDTLNILNRGQGIKVKINNFYLKLPTRYFRYFPKDYEASNFNFLESVCKQGDTIIDVGAHFGLFSVRAAQITGSRGRVFSFEPAPQTIEVLKKTIHINNMEDIVVPVQAAMSEEDGQANFFTSDTIGDVANSLVDYQDSVHVSAPVELVQCDSFVTKNNIKVGFLKIDAEGAELSVLKGAVTVLKEQRPFCILSMHPASIIKFGDTNEKIWNFLQGLNYHILVNNEPVNERFFCNMHEMFEVHLIPK